MAVGRTCALSVVVLVAVLASGAAAAPNCSALLSQGCTCAVPVEAGSPVGTLAVIAGDVRKSGAQQYTPLAVNTVVNLQPGDGILVGDRGEAELSAGGRCQARKLGPQSSLVVREVNGCACVAVVGRQQTDTTETGSIAVGVGGAVAAAAGAGGLFLLLDHPISP